MTRIKIHAGHCQFSDLVSKVENFCCTGKSLWGYMCSITQIETRNARYTLLFDVGDYHERRVRVFLNTREACAALILSCGCIPDSLTLSDEQADHSELVKLVLANGEKESFGTCWSADPDALLKASADDGEDDD